MIEATAKSPVRSPDGSRDGRRRSQRRSGTVDVQFGQQGRRYKVKLLDLSRHGARLSVSHALRTSDMCWISLPGLQPISAKVTWVEGFVIGCEFETPLHEAIFDHMLTRVTFGEVVDRRTKA